MISPILRLSTDELLSALDGIDPVDALVEELVGRADDDGGSSSPDGRLTPWRGGGSADAPGTGLMLLEDQRAGSRCVLPAAALYGFRTAALAALAGRTFVAPGVVTAAVLGSGFAAQVSLTLIARYLSGLSHVAVCPTGDEPTQPLQPLQPRVMDQLDLAGVSWSVTPAAAEAVFGATLVVAAIAGAPWSELGRLSKGSALVNATGVDLPVDAVDQVYVDDAALIGTMPHRYFTKLNTDRTWSVRTGQRLCRVEADLAQVLTGAHAGRTHVDHILLVELLSTDAQDVRLAGLLHRAALEQGLGVREHGPGTDHGSRRG